MKKLADVKIDPTDKYGSLDLCKLVGKKILRIEGYPTSEYGKDSMVFFLRKIVFEDGTSVDVEGEHDLPYLASNWRNPLPGLDNEQLLALYEEENEE